jgi:hypothetical protein
MAATFGVHRAANNSGVFLYTEILTPFMILFLALYNRRTNPNS